MCLDGWERRGNTHAANIVLSLIIYQEYVDKSGYISLIPLDGSSSLTWIGSWNCFNDPNDMSRPHGST
jgi:hypothetical protein